MPRRVPHSLSSPSCSTAPPVSVTRVMSLVAALERRLETLGAARGRVLLDVDSDRRRQAVVRTWRDTATLLTTSESVWRTTLAVVRRTLEDTRLDPPPGPVTPEARWDAAQRQTAQRCLEAIHGHWRNHLALQDLADKLERLAPDLHEEENLCRAGGPLLESPRAVAEQLAQLQRALAALVTGRPKNGQAHA